VHAQQPANAQERMPIALTPELVKEMLSGKCAGVDESTKVKPFEEDLRDVLAGLAKCGTATAYYNQVKVALDNDRTITLSFVLSDPTINGKWIAIESHPFRRDLNSYILTKRQVGSKFLMDLGLLNLFKQMYGNLFYKIVFTDVDQSVLRINAPCECDFSDKYVFVQSEGLFKAEASKAVIKAELEGMLRSI